MKSAVNFVLTTVFVYAWIAVVNVLVKLLTPFLDDSSWYQVLVVMPVGGTGLWWLYQFLVRRIDAWINRRDGES